MFRIRATSWTIVEQLLTFKFSILVFFNFWAKKKNLLFKFFYMFIKFNNNKLSTFQTGKVHENFVYFINKLRSNFKNFLLPEGALAAASRTYIV